MDENAQKKQPSAIATPIKPSPLEAIAGRSEEERVSIIAERTSQTLATLSVSLGTHKEIKYLLEQAGYNHAIDGDQIDMTGIALVHDIPKTMIDTGSA